MAQLPAHLQPNVNAQVMHCVAQKDEVGGAEPVLGKDKGNVNKAGTPHAYGYPADVTILKIFVEMLPEAGRGYERGKERHV